MIVPVFYFLIDRELYCRRRLFRLVRDYLYGHCIWNGGPAVVKTVKMIFAALSMGAKAGTVMALLQKMKPSKRTRLSVDYRLNRG